MIDFERTLRFLNLEPQKSKSFGRARIWETVSILGLGGANALVLEVGSNTTASEVREAVSSPFGKASTAVFRRDQELNRLSGVLRESGITNSLLERDILFEAAKKLLGTGSKLDLPRATIEPAILDAKDNSVGLCTRKVADWVRESGSGSLAVLTGPAGFGKTTICKILVNRILDAPVLKRIPLYISSANWQHLIEQHHVTLRGVFLEAVSSTFAKAAIGEEMVEHLIAQGAIIPIFDGLDEICTDAYTEIGIREIVSQLEELFSETPEARVLFTTRTTFWSTARADDRLRFSEFRIQSFDSERRNEFLEEWFDRDAEAKSRATSLLGRIEALGNSGPRSDGEDEVLFSESPYMLHLACLAAEEQSGLGFDEATWADVRDPLDAVLRSLSAREVFKNKIQPGKQNRILYTTALLHGENFSVDDFSEVIELYEEEGERLDGMLSHHVIGGRGDRRKFLFHGFGDYLRAKAIASWLFDGEDQIFGVEEYLADINSENDTSVDIFGEISGFYGGIDTLRLAFAREAVQKLFLNRTGQGLLLLLARSVRQQGMLTHEEVATELNEIFLGGSGVIENIHFEGQIEGVSFRGLRFDNCEFLDTIFRNCEFDKDTKFLETCVFKKDFAVYACEGFGECLLEATNLSTQARAVFASRKVRGSDRRVSREDIETLFGFIFSQMQTSDLNYRDISREGLISRAQKKNSYIANAVIDVLQKNGVLKITRQQSKHKTRVGVGKPEDVIAFHREGASVRSVRKSVNEVMQMYS